MAKWRVYLKTGEVLTAYEVEHIPGFVKLHSWRGEERIPSGEVERIEDSKTHQLIDGLLLIAAIFFIAAGVLYFS